MNWHEFVFAKEHLSLLHRHIVFLAGMVVVFLWLKIFLSGRIHFLRAGRQISRRQYSNCPSQWEQLLDSVLGSGSDEFIRSLLMLSTHMIACYIVIYFLFSTVFPESKIFRIP